MAHGDFACVEIWTHDIRLNLPCVLAENSKEQKGGIPPEAWDCTKGARMVAALRHPQISCVFRCQPDTIPLWPA